MTKLEIVQLAKKSKNQETVAKAINEHFAGQTRETDSMTCYAFSMNCLDRDTRKTFCKNLEKK